MKLSAIRIENFRSFKARTILLDDFTCFVGPNGGGKSTILMALNVFFRNSVPNHNLLLLTKDDFHHGNIADPIKITLTFEDLSQEAQDDFKNYYRQGKLIVFAKAVWDSVAQNAPVMQHGSRMSMHDFKAYFAKDKEGEKVAALRDFYKELQKKYKDLPVATTKPDMEQSLRDYEEAHPKLCTPTESNDEFYGYTKGAGLLPKYVQWVYIPAIKDIASEQDENKRTAIGQLLERTVRSKVDFKKIIGDLRKETSAKYEEILNNEKKVLDDLEKSLESRLKEWSHPKAEVDLKWNFDEDKSVSIADPLARIKLGEDKFVGEIARLGHGLQRSFLVAILHELSLSNTDISPRLLLGFEEPEIFQHPPQARHMANLLENLTGKNSQIIITTHCPLFVPGKGFENVRMVKKNTSSYDSHVTQLTLTELEKAISGALGQESRPPTAMVATIEQIMQPSLKELFFTHKTILVEGIEDVAFISTYMHLTGLWPKFREYGCHFIVSVGKTSLSRPLAIANAFSIPAFVIIDGDIDNKKNEGQNKRDNVCILNLCNVKGSPLPEEIIWAENLIIWPTRIYDVVKDDIGKTAWEAAEVKVKKENGWEELKSKNSMLITAILEELWKQGKKSSILIKACEYIIAFAKK